MCELSLFPLKPDISYLRHSLLVRIVRTNNQQQINNVVGRMPERM